MLTQGSARSDHLGKRRPGAELHGEKLRFECGEAVVQPCERRMLERLENGSLAPEAPECAWPVHQRMAHHFQGDRLPSREIPRLVDNSHPAPTDALNYLITMNMFATETIVSCGP
jgi:hypothetical protein